MSPSTPPLERAGDVVARGLVVALAPVAARAPREHVRAQEVGRKRRAVGQRQRLGEEGDRGRDARDQVAGDAEAEEHLGPVEIGERRALDEPARLLEQVDRGLDLAALRRGPASPDSARNWRSIGRSDDRRARVAETRRSPRRSASSISASPRVERRLGPGALVGGDAALEEERVDAELLGQPLDRLGRRLRLAALDLADVLLREPLAGELALGQPGGLRSVRRRCPAATRRRRRCPAGRTSEDAPLTSDSQSSSSPER